MSDFDRDVKILVTGGTLDKVHNVLTEGLDFSRAEGTHLPDILDIGRCEFTNVETVLQKDSAEFDDSDRQLIADAAANTAEPSMVITHGTVTMGITARFLKELMASSDKHAALKNKTIILTGAMRPFSLGKSDATFNLGGAIIAAQTLPAGIYGIMNGRIFEASKLTKNTQTGRFDR